MKPRLLAVACGAVLLISPVWAHDFKLGDLRVDHPYATPTLPGLNTGAVYFRGIRNTGKFPDRLLSATTPVAARVEIHRMTMKADVMQMRAVPSLEIPAGLSVPMKHGSADGHHLMLLDLKAPLRDGERFPVTLTFERAGTREVMAWVQTPRTSGTGSKAAEHRHRH
ncbi:copper chaperone PCu(A)C [Hydrogenophaga sp.]|uniref:copper chaperone PCu(A)C n=1 Tax=Hydrogenophaga sp. TaxID=1904254 RepID=UPI00261F8ABB|nr:copper chaperone PCu(A)C [Hydrogenophaga sp.]MDM7948643.1 copper chaperone PCu(A)C [Hydrogenophaga sp.]